MRAVMASQYNDPDMRVVDDEFQRPTLDRSNKKHRQFMIVRVLACALAPGDIRVQSGITREIQGMFGWALVLLLL